MGMCVLRVLVREEPQPNQDTNERCETKQWLVHETQKTFTQSIGVIRKQKMKIRLEILEILFGRTNREFMLRIIFQLTDNGKMGISAGVDCCFSKPNSVQLNRIMFDFGLYQIQTAKFLVTNCCLITPLLIMCVYCNSTNSFCLLFFCISSELEISLY